MHISLFEITLKQGDYSIVFGQVDNGEIGSALFGLSATRILMLDTMEDKMLINFDICFIYFFYTQIQAIKNLFNKKEKAK